MNQKLVKPIILFTNNTEIINTFDTTFQIIGYTGGSLLSICLVPQVIKIIKTKSGDDLSYSWQFMALIGLFYILHMVYIIIYYLFIFLYF